MTPANNTTLAELLGLTGKDWPTLRSRFMAKVRQTEACWHWIGTRSRYGYGMVKWGGRTRGRRSYLAHRVSWVLDGREFRDGLHLLHACNEPLCVRPEHLRLGTQADNNQDRKVAGHYVKGPAHWWSSEGRAARGVEGSR